MDSAALFVSFVAAAAGLASAVIAWFARGDALKAQARAEAAQMDAARSEGRSVAATERMATIQSTVFEGPPWEVTWFGGDSFLVTNTSAVDALDVMVGGEPDDVAIMVTDVGPRFVGAKSAFKFMFSPSLAHGWERDIVVRWTRADSGEKRTWKHPIPSRPERR